MPGRHTAGPHARPGRGTSARGRGAAVPLAAGVVLVAAAAGWSLTSGGGFLCAGDTTLDLAVAPEIAPVVEDVVSGLGSVELGAEDVCLSVATTEPDDALAALGAGAQAPDLWIPDSSAWLSQLTGPMRRRPAWSVASSPVVLAGPAGAARPDTWLDGLSAPGAALLDPRESGAGIGALVALHAEAARGDTSGTALSRRLVAEAQSAAAVTLSDGALLADAVGGGGEAPRWFPTTEQRFAAVAGRAAAHGVGISVPATGTALLDYPLVPVATGDYADAATTAGRALAARLRSPEAARALREAGFRPPSGTPVDAAGGVGRVVESGSLRPDAVAGLLRTWTALNADARMLAVLDVSGSMEDGEGSRSRIELARDAMLDALGTMPDTWDLGLWAFSQGLGPGTDHRELAPLRTLVALSGDRTHREVLADAVRRLPAVVGGGTALYDTTLAAYREVVSGYLSDRFNSVVLLTDGRNEDPEGIGLRRLLDELERLQTAARPAPVITVAMGRDADTTALRRIAEATGGVGYVARDPQDIQGILAGALLERVGWRLR
jgi:Bacterial extracellular solute-binding protein/von Willebrand factor type A domain